MLIIATVKRSHWLVFAATENRPKIVLTQNDRVRMTLQSGVYTIVSRLRHNQPEEPINHIITVDEYLSHFDEMYTEFVPNPQDSQEYTLRLRI